MSRQTQTGVTSLVEAVQSGVSSGAGGWVTMEVALSRVAPHPENARRDLGDLDELAYSLQRLGQLQALIVDRAELVLAERPDLAAALGAAEFVLRAGHRRLAAAAQAGLETVRVEVAPAADQKMTYATFLHENTLRAGLSPIEEAGVYGQMVKLGLQQSEIADLTGLSKSQITRRLQLLGLTQVQQDAVHTGEVSARAARDLLALPVDERAVVWSATVGAGLTDQLGAAVVRAREDLAKREAVAGFVGQIHASGYELVQEAPAGWRPVAEGEELSAASETGPVAAVAQPYGIEYFTRDEAASWQMTHEEVVARERAAARVRRLQAAQQLVQAPAAGGEVLRDMQRAMLAGFDRARALKLAYAWLSGTLRGGKVDNGKGERTPIDDVEQWASALRRSDADQRQWFAWALGIAGDELRAGKEDDWGPETVAYVQVLMQVVGYQPTTWERWMMAGRPAPSLEIEPLVRAAVAAGAAKPAEWEQWKQGLKQ